MNALKSKPPMPPPPAWTLQEPEKEYHARSKSGEIMSSGMLKKFRQCAAAYHDAVTRASAEKESAAFRFGRAVHKICLEGTKAFNKSFAIGGPVNEKTGKNYGVGTKAHDEWLAANGYTKDQVINDDEANTLITMARKFERHPEVAARLEFGWPEMVVRADLHGVPCQVRLDWLAHDADGNFLIVDLKTTENMKWYENDSYRYEYPHQFAFYRDVCMAACPATSFSFSVIAVEKNEPFRVGVWDIPENVLEYHSAENRLALENFKQCQITGVWPTGYETVREFPMPRTEA